MPDREAIYRRNLDRLISEGGFGSDEEARAVVTTHMAERLQLSPYEVNYDSMANEFFGGADTSDPQVLAEALQRETKWRFEDEEIDNFRGLDEDARMSQAMSNLGINEDADDEAKQRAVKRWEGTLLNKSKKNLYAQLKPHMTDEIRQLTRAALVSGEVNWDVYSNMTRKDQAVFRAYSNVIDPERASSIKGLFWEPIKSQIENTLSGLLKIAQAGDDVLNAHEEITPIYAVHSLNSFNKDWDKMLKGGALWKSEADRLHAAEHIAKIRWEDYGKDKPYQEVFNDTLNRIDDIAQTAAIELDDRKFRQEQAQLGRFSIEKGAFKDDVIKGSMGVLTSYSLAIASRGLTVLADTAGMSADVYEKLRDNGADRTLAFNVGAVAAVPYYLIEKMQIKGLDKLGKGVLSKWLVSKQFRKTFEGSFTTALKQAGVNALGNYTEQTIQESAQTAVEKAALAVGELVEGEDLFDNKQLFKEWAVESFDAAKAMLLVPGAVGAGRTGAYKARAMVDPKFKYVQDEWVANEKLQKIDDESFRKDAEAEWNSLPQATKSAYLAADSNEEATTVLEEAGIIEAPLVHATMRDSSQLEIMQADRELRTERRENLRQDLAKFERMEQALTKAGYDVKLVDMLSLATDPNQVGQISGDTIELLSHAADKGRVLTHEGFHAAMRGGVEMGIVTQKDIDVLINATTKEQYQEILDRYNDPKVSLSERLEDVMADIVAVQPEHETTFKRAINAIKDFFGIVTNEQDVARRIKKALEVHADQINAPRKASEEFREQMVAEPEAAPGFDIANADLAVDTEQTTEEVAEEIAEEDTIEAVDLDQIERDLNVEYDAGIAIDTLIKNFNKAADKTKASDDKFFRELYANDFRSMENAIASNEPARVKKSAIVLRDKMRKWDKMKDDAKLALLEQAEEQGVQFAQGEQYSLFEAAQQYALAKLRGNRNMQQIAEAIAKRATVDAKAITEFGEAIDQRTRSIIGDKATELERQLAVEDATSDLAIKRELRDAAVFGVRQGQFAGRAQQRVIERRKQAEKRAKAKTKAKTKGQSLSQVSRNAGVEMKKDILINPNKAVDKMIEASTKHALVGIDQTRLTIETISKATADAVRSMVQHRTLKDRRRQDLLAKARDIAKLKTVDGARKNAQLIVDSIVEANEWKDQAAVKKHIDATLAKHGKPLKQGKRIKGGQYTRTVLSKAKELWEMTGPAYEKAHKAAYDQSNIDPAEFDIAELDERYAALYPMLQAIKIVNDAKTRPSLATYNEMDRQLTHFITTGSERFDTEWELRKAKETEARNTMASIVKATAEPKNKSESQIAFAGMSPIGAVRHVLGNDGIGRQVVDILDRVINRTQTDSKRFQDQIEKSIKEKTGKNVTGLTAGWAKVRPEFAKKYSTIGKALSKDQLAYMMMLSQRSDMVDLHLNKNEAFTEVHNNYAEMRKEFSTNELILIDEMMSGAEKYYETLNDAILNATGLPPTHNDGYIPAHWFNESGGYKAVVSGIHDIPSFLKPTIKHKRGIDENRSFTTEMINHVGEMAKFKHGDADKQFLSRTILSHVVTKELTKKYGPTVTSMLATKVTEAYMDKSLTSMAAQSVDNKVAGIASGVTATFALMGRAPSAARQVVDVNAGLNEYDLRAFSEALKGGSIEDFQKFYSHPLVKSRIKFGSGLVERNAMESLTKLQQVPGLNIIGSAMKKLSRTSGYADAMIMSWVGSSLVKAEMASKEHEGKTQEEAYEDAMALTVGRLERVYQSGKAKDLGDHLRNMDNMKKVMYQFLGPDAPKMSQELSDIKTALRDKDKDAILTASRTVLINHLALALPQLGVSFIMQNWIGDDEMDEDEAIEALVTILMGPYRAIIFAGIVADGIVGLADKGSRPSPPAYRTIANFFRTMKYVSEEVKDGDVDVSEMLLEIADAFGTVRDAKAVIEKINE